MRNPISILFLLLVVSGLSACAQPVANAGNSPEEQRSRAHGAQGELSSEVHK